METFTLRHVNKHLREKCGADFETLRGRVINIDLGSPTYPDVRAVALEAFLDDEERGLEGMLVVRHSGYRVDSFLCHFSRVVGVANPCAGCQLNPQTCGVNNPTKDCVKP